MFIFKSPFWQVCLVILAACFVSAPKAQAIWLETGLAYNEQPNLDTNEPYTSYLRVGVRGLIPINKTVSYYIAPQWFGGLGLDTGAWFTFPVTLDDLEGFRSYAGTGLSYTRGKLGLALSAALSYELNRNTDVVAVYTHRPLFTNGLTQAFDISLGFAYTFR